MNQSFLCAWKYYKNGFSFRKNGNELTNEYSYDKVSNRISRETKVKGELSALADVNSEEVQVTEGRTTYTYNALNQLVTESSPEGSITYTYDANGNLIKQSGSKTVDYNYDKENHLLRATVQQGNSVTIESYTYDYSGNRLSKTVNESNTTYYVNDTSGSLTQVVAETDKDGKETANYTRGDDLLSMERGGEIWYYHYDGHGSTRLLTNKAGEITDRYAYDAYGNLLQKEGDTENDFLYTGEQYNANANPVTYTDPTGYYSLADVSVGMACATILTSSCYLIYINLVNNIKNTIYQNEAQNIAANNIAFTITSGISDWIIEYSVNQSVATLVPVVKEGIEEKTKEKTKSKNIYTVYTLEDSDDNVRYVGRTKDYEGRMKKHSEPIKIKQIGVKMSSWGTKLYQSDIADMVRDDYKNKLRAGKSDEETLEEILMEYQNEMNDVEDKFDFWPALADTMWRYGRLIPEIRDTCLSIISVTQEDIRWETEKDKAKRQKEMQALKEKLLSEMPARKKVSVHKPYVCDWKEREVYSMQIEDDGKDGKYNGCYIVIYVVGMYRGEYSVPGIFDIVPEIYLMLSREEVKQAEDIRNLELCCSVCNRKKNERRINYLICETSNRKRPKNIRYIGRMKEKFVPDVEYQIQDMKTDMLWWSWIQHAIRDYEFSIKINKEIQEKEKLDDG